MAVFFDPPGSNFFGIAAKINNAGAEQTPAATVEDEKSSPRNLLPIVNRGWDYMRCGKKMRDVYLFLLREFALLLFPSHARQVESKDCLAAYFACKASLFWVTGEVSRS